MVATPSVPCVYIDTSVLRGTSWSSAPFRSLMALSEAGRVQTTISTVTFDEYRTQWRETYREKISSAESALARFTRDVVVKEAKDGRFDAALGAIPKSSDAEVLSQSLYENYFDKHRVKRAPIGPGHASEVFERYFRGDPPFKKVKARDDIPDGFIWAAARDLAASGSTLHCAVHDEALRSAIADIPNCVVYRDFPTLLQAPELVAALASWEDDKAWRALKPSLSFKQVGEEIALFVDENVGRFVENKSIRSPLIPDETDTASVQMYDAPTSVTSEVVDDWGGGWLNVEVAFELVATVEFYIFRADAYMAEPEISVSMGDPEEDHYFDASAEVRLKVTATLAAKVDLSRPPDADDETAILEEVAIDGEPTLEVLGFA